VPRHRILAEDLAQITTAPLPWSSFAGKTVLISGVSGFLPSYMAEALLYLNETDPAFRCRVAGVARNADRAAQRFAHHGARPDLAIIVQDVCEPLAWDGPVDFVIHAASQASPKYYGADPAGTLTPNVIGTHHLLNLARTKGVEGLLFLSSSEVYGRMDPSVAEIREDDGGFLDPATLRACYGESKRMGETMCVAWASQYGVPAKIVRPFHTYGPGMPLADGRAHSDFVADALAGRNITLHSGGSARRAFCYAADAVAGFFTVLLRGTAGAAYNVGNDQAEISMLDLARLIAGLLPEKKLAVTPGQTARPAGYLASAVDRAFPCLDRIKALGWRPTTSLADGFRRTIASFAG
jgi:nucleoside-diphosphate-sugar epimerase